MACSADERWTSETSPHHSGWEKALFEPEKRRRGE
jgi:hypothetical protein